MLILYTGIPWADVCARGSTSGPHPGVVPGGHQEMFQAANTVMATSCMMTASLFRVCSALPPPLHSTRPGSTRHLRPAVVGTTHQGHHAGREGTKAAMTVRRCHAKDQLFA